MNRNTKIIIGVIVLVLALGIIVSIQKARQIDGSFGGFWSGSPVKTEVVGVNIVKVEPQPYNKDILVGPYSVEVVAKVYTNSNDDTGYHTMCIFIVNGIKDSQHPSGMDTHNSFPNTVQLRDVGITDPNVEITNIGICCQKKDDGSKQYDICDYHNLK